MFWSLIIDTQIKYEFKVQTNFNHIELQELEKKFDSEQNNNSSSKRIQNMLNEYINSSFMT